MSPDTTITFVPFRSQPTERQATEHPANMVNQQKSGDQPNAKQLELALNLNHSARDELIISLNQLSTILQSNKPIPADAKQRARKKIYDSIRLLVDLSPFELAQSTDESNEFEETIADQLAFKMTRADRSTIMNHLTDLKDAVQFGRLICETKRNLITENKRIIHQLIDLPAREQSDQTCAGSAEDSGDNSVEPPSKQQMGKLL